MKVITKVVVVAALLVFAGGCKHSGKRAEAKDTHCRDDNKVAYDFQELDDAREAGCSEVRVHMGKKDPKTGEFQDHEALVWCCPQ